MARSLPSLLVAYFAFSTTALSIPPLPRPHLPDFLTVGPSHVHAQQTPLLDTLDIWIEQERKVALERLLANIKPGGRNTEVRDRDEKKVVDGTVLASPSRDHPDYFYQWVRDAAITMNSLVDMYNDDPSSAFSSKLSAIIDAYAKLQGKIQHTNNPSGSFDDLQGLGEPKFQVDGTPFEASWGRPQRDGPALRAITLIRYLRAYNASHPTLWASPQSDDFFKPLYEAKMPPKSVIKADLEYVSHYWNQSSFDLWEEIEGLHFFTLMVSSRALKEGAQLARTFGDNGAVEWYEEQASYIENTLQQFWDNEKGHLVETLESDRSGLDCGLLLGTLHALPTQGTKLKPTYPPWSDEILVSLLALTRDQHDRFPINSKYSDWNENAEDENPSSTFRFQGTGLGRYPEDVYDGYGTSYRGGNPWFLCTSSAAEVLYQTATHISRVSNLTITSKNHPFFSSLLSTSSLKHSLEVNASYGPSDALFHSVIERLAEAGDEFLEVVKRHVDESGGMSEQFDRRSGYMRGAGDLTWSYGAFLMAEKGRAAMHEELGKEE